MSRIVADASFCGAWVLPDEASPRAEKVLRLLLQGDLELWAPSLWAYEMTNLLLSASRRERIEEAGLFEALDLVAKVPLKHTDIPGVLARERMLRLALRFDLSAYDAAYLELADRLRAPLHTTDRSLAKAAKALDLAP